MKLKLGKTNDSFTYLLDSTIKGTRYLFGLTALQKIVSFLLNILVMRKVNLKSAGIASIQMELILSTILFISREGFRLSLLRSSGIESYRNMKLSSGREQLQKLTNMAWLPIPIGLIITILVTSAAVIRGNITPDMDTPHYNASVLLYCVAAGIELLSEPLFILAQSSLYFGIRASSEGAAFLIKSIVLFLCINFNLGLISFGISQIAYSCVILLMYGFFFIKNIYYDSSFPFSTLYELFPSKVVTKTSKSNWFDDQSVQLAFTQMLQSLCKHVMTEGDKLFLSLLGTYDFNGVYSTAINIGSLAPRLLFLPIEETSRSFFSKCLHSSSPLTLEKQEEQKLKAYKFFTLLLKVICYIGLIFACFGSCYTETLCYLMLGKEKSQTSIPYVLSYYCFYVLFLGFNGISEAFVFAVASKEQVMKLNSWLLLFFLVYVISVLFFMKLLQMSSVGLILANCLSMSCRISYCYKFISSYFLQSPKIVIKTKDFIPHSLVLACFCIIFFILSTFSRYIFDLKGQNTLLAHLTHVFIGLLCGIILILLVYYKEKDFRKSITDIFQIKKQE